MDHLEFTATFPHIPADRLEEFKELARRAIERGRSETGCRQYDWFFNDDETVCSVREAYDDSDAVIAHAGNVGDLVEKMVAMGGGLKVETYGELSPELVEVIAPMQPTSFSFFGGS